MAREELNFCIEQTKKKTKERSKRWAWRSVNLSDFEFKRRLEHINDEEDLSNNIIRLRDRTGTKNLKAQKKKKKKSLSFWFQFIYSSVAPFTVDLLYRFKYLAASRNSFCRVVQWQCINQWKSMLIIASKHNRNETSVLKITAKGHNIMHI